MQRRQVHKLSETYIKEEEDEMNADDSDFILDILNYYMRPIFADLGFNVEGGEFVYAKKGQNQSVAAYRHRAETFTDEPANPKVLDNIDETPPQKGLENNPGKDGHTFNDTHPYFPKNCSQCPAYRKSGIKNRLLTLFENRKKDCYNCPFIDVCIDRMQAKQAIDNAAFARKQEVKDSDLMPKLDKQPCDAVKSGTLNRTNKVRNTLLKHCHHDYDVDAAIHIWNNPNEMKFIRVSPLGEGKDMSLPKNQANIRKKMEDLHFVEFRQYEFSYNGRTFEVKLALCKKGYEQFYSLKEK